MKKFWILLLLAGAPAFLTPGCAQLGIQPETFNQRLAVSYSTVTTIRQTALTLLQAKKISVADARHIQEQADNARSGLDIARAMRADDPKGADNKLESVRTALAALNAYLVAKGSP